jgi:hypothetical protein
MLIECHNTRTRYAAFEWLGTQAKHSLQQSLCLPRRASARTGTNLSRLRGSEAQTTWHVQCTPS